MVQTPKNSVDVVRRICIISTSCGLGKCTQADVGATWRGCGLISLLLMYVKNCPGSSSKRAWTTEICPPVQTTTNLLDGIQWRSSVQKIISTMRRTNKEIIHSNWYKRYVETGFRVAREPSSFRTSLAWSSLVGSGSNNQLAEPWNWYSIHNVTHAKFLFFLFLFFALFYR